MEPPSSLERNFWQEYWIGFRPFLLAQTIDLSRFTTLWISVSIAHLVQRLVLSLGWLPLVVKIVDFAENVLVVVTVTMFLVLTTARTLWVFYRELRKK